ncbi:MAG: TonB family protein [Bryobacteraceae bacterium]
MLLPVFCLLVIRVVSLMIGSTLGISSAQTASCDPGWKPARNGGCERDTTASKAQNGGTGTSTPQPSPPILLQRIEPEYSQEALAAGYQGTAALYVEVDPSGNPDTVYVIQGLGLDLDKKAVEAVRRWRFRPATSSNGQPMRVGLAVEVKFRLPNQGPWHVSRAQYGLPASGSPVLAQYTRPDPTACEGRSGVVEVGFVIDKRGNTAKVQPTRGEHGPLAEAAVQAVENWRYQPGRIGRKLIATRGHVELACSVNADADDPAVNDTSSRALRVGNGVSVPSPIYKAEPFYSEAARRAKLQGSTLLYVEIYPDGYAHHIRTLRMLGLGLDAMAIAAVRQWRFKPSTRDGQPVIVRAEIEVNFRLI